MMTWFFAILCIASIAAAQSSQPQTSGFGVRPQEPAKAGRQLRREAGRPIDAQLQPSDTDVEVIDESPGGFSFPPGPGHPDYLKPIAQRLAERFDVIVFVDVIRQTGRLTRAKDWIDTDTITQVGQVLKSPSEMALAVGSEVTIEAPGGTVKIGKTVVRARRARAKTVDNGKQYLVFGRVDRRPTGVTIVTTASGWLVSDGTKFVPVSPGTSPFPDEGVDKDELLKQIADYARAR